jgi:hypothetical protein
MTGYVAKKEFKSIKALKGKTVGTELGHVESFPPSCRRSKRMA